MATSETSAEGGHVDTDCASPTVSIVIPAFNEAARIGDSIQKIGEFLKTAPFQAEVIVVDDGSTDETSAIVQEAQFPGLRLLRNPTNHGKGYSVRQGVLAATGDYVLFTDADLSAPIEELAKLYSVALQENAEVVVGSRAMDSTFIDKHQSWIREVGGILFNRMVRLLLGLKIHDTQCGFKLFKRKSAYRIFERQTTDGFGFDPELLFLASRQRLKIVEVPVRWSHADGSKIRFMRDGLRMFGDLLRIRWNQITGRYS